jgi:hypothetical protein
MSKQALKARDKVNLLVNGETWAQAKVIDALSSQFTVTHKKKVLFFFYSDEGVTWSRV